MDKQSRFDLVNTYIHLKDDGAASPIEVNETFWEELMSGGGERSLEEGRLVTAHHWAEDWDSWEMHPAGDEIAFLVSGQATFILEEPNGGRGVELHPGTYCIVPRGTWHTAKIQIPSTIIFMTSGAGTQHRPMKRRPDAASNQRRSVVLS